jgi:hypothetical protein
MAVVSPFAAGLAHPRPWRPHFLSHIVGETGAAYARRSKGDQASVRLLFVLYRRVSSLIRERTGTFAAAPREATSVPRRLRFRRAVLVPHAEPALRGGVRSRAAPVPPRCRPIEMRLCTYKTRLRGLGTGAQRRQGRAVGASRGFSHGLSAWLPLPVAINHQTDHTAQNPAGESNHETWE